MIYYNISTGLTNSLSDVPSKLISSFHVFQKMLLTYNFLYRTENLIQCPFRQAGVLLFFGWWCFCLISKCSYVLNNFRHYFHTKAFKIPLTIRFNNFWLCLLKLLVKVTAMSVKYLLRLLQYFLIISFFLNMCVLCFVSASCLVSLDVCFLNISVNILTEIPVRLSNLFYTNSFIFVDVNVDPDWHNSRKEV